MVAGKGLRESGLAAVSQMASAVRVSAAHAARPPAISVSASGGTAKRIKESK